MRCVLCSLTGSCIHLQFFQDQDESVEEYDFTNELETEEPEDNDHDTDFYKSSDGVITISSDDDMEKAVGDVDWRPTDRPWREPGFGEDARYQYEIMFCTFTTDQMGGDWEVTEEYQHEKDNQMMR